MALRVRPLLLSLLFLSLGLLSACGGDEPSAKPGPDASATDVPPFPAETIPPAALLKRLHDRVASGAGMSDDTWGRDVSQVGMSLWPPAAGTGDAGQTEPRRRHASLSHVAGDIARELSKGAEARAAAVLRDAVSVEIHDEFLKASAGSVDAYRAWVEGAGSDLYRRLEEDRQRFFKDPPK